MSKARGSARKLISGPSFREQAREFIRGLIVTGQMLPEALYSVPQLAAELHVSATPVREALLDLAREGLLEPVRNRGFRVVALTTKELNDIYSIRLLLEVPSIAEAARRGGTKKQIRELLDLAEATQQAAAKGDLITYVQTDRKFHIALVDLVDNRQLSDLVATLRDRVRLYGLSNTSTREHMARSAVEHFALIKYIEEREVEAAASAMRKHLERSRDVWSATIQQVPPRPALGSDEWLPFTAANPAE